MIKRNFKNVLVIQLGDIGDVVLSIPVFRALRENYPGAKIAVAVRAKAKELVEHFPFVDNVISIEQNRQGFLKEIVYQYKFFSRLRRNHFDLAVDLRSGTRGAILAFLSGAPERVSRLNPDDPWRNKLFTSLYKFDLHPTDHVSEFNFKILKLHGIAETCEEPRIDITPDMKRRAANILEKEQVNSDRPLIAVQPFSLWEYKEWGVEKFSTLMNRILSNYNASVLITGSPNEHDKAQIIKERCKEFDSQVFNLAGKTSLSELAAILGFCALFIGMDSAGMHLAGAVGTPTAIIFGPSSPILWAPRGPQHCIIQKDLPCLPCNQKGCNGLETSRCLKELEVDEVWTVLKVQLEKNDLFRKK